MEPNVIQEMYRHRRRLLEMSNQTANKQIGEDPERATLTSYHSAFNYFKFHPRWLRTDNESNLLECGVVPRFE